MNSYTIDPRKAWRQWISALILLVECNPVFLAKLLTSQQHLFDFTTEYIPLDPLKANCMFNYLSNRLFSAEYKDMPDIHKLQAIWLTYRRFKIRERNYRRKGCQVEVLLYLIGTLLT
ncbi:hypothetical protein K7432_018448 [Basidiobolus ranarum]|uniref:Uncharacterized protein n=1 Tax=Basidiobolus ranarum TaxID=34480 RepID=A0ABR2WC65_9FUNG